VRKLERLSERLESLAKLYVSVDPDRPLQRGFARVTRQDGSLVRAGASLASGETIDITFGDGATRQAVVDGAMVDGPGASAKPARSRGKSPTPAQGDLF
jgi:exodeoxyribonuclease VII large subunit